MRRDVRRQGSSSRGGEAVGGGATANRRARLSDEELVDLLRTSKAAYAESFITARTKGTELEPDRKATVEDARMWARRNIIARHDAGEQLDDPEVVRWLLILRFGSPALSED